MTLKAKTIKWFKSTSSVHAILVTEDNWQEELKEFNQYFKGDLVKFIKNEQFLPKEGHICSYYTGDKIPAPILVMIGVGKKADFSNEKIRNASAILVRFTKKTKKPILSIDLDAGILANKDIQNMSKIISEGLLLGNYKFDKYKTLNKKSNLQVEEVWLLTTPSKIQHCANGIENGILTSQATNFTRNLVNEPSSITTPLYLATVAKNMAKKSNIKVEIWDEKLCRKMGLNAYLAIAQGSSVTPKFIKLTYKNSIRLKNGQKPKIVLIGKALTFDSGGLSLKDAKSMENMKLDMAGGATVLGIFSILEKLKLKADIIGLIPACENMPGNNAVKPGDIVTAKNGKTIEILNTDAEGRVVLADALSVASELKPDMIIDLATLTGACMVALGEDIAGLFTNNKDLKNKLLQSASITGGKFWELPLEKNYKDLIKSDIADLANVAKTRYGGAITAAIFLEEFVGNIPWIHLDIAGPAFAEKDLPLIAKGGSGFGVRTLIQFLSNFV